MAPEPVSPQTPKPPKKPSLWEKIKKALGKADEDVGEAIGEAKFDQ